MPMTIAVPLALIRARLLMSGAILHVCAVSGTDDLSQTGVEVSARTDWTHGGLSRWSHSPQCDECDHLLCGAVAAAGEA